MACLRRGGYSVSKITILLSSPGLLYKTFRTKIAFAVTSGNIIGQKFFFLGLVYLFYIEGRAKLLIALMRHGQIRLMELFTHSRWSLIPFIKFYFKSRHFPKDRKVLFSFLVISLT